MFSGGRLWTGGQEWWMRGKLHLCLAGSQKVVGQLNSRQGAHDQRHFSFKDAKCSLHHVGRPSRVPSAPHSVSIATSQLPYERTWPLYRSSFVCSPLSSFLRVPTIYLWGIVTHSSRILAESQWLCSLSGWIRRPAKTLGKTARC